MFLVQNKCKIHSNTVVVKSYPIKYWDWSQRTETYVNAQSRNFVHLNFI